MSNDSREKTSVQPLYTLTRAHRRAMRHAQMSRRKFLVQTGVMGAAALPAVGAAQNATPAATPLVELDTGAGTVWEPFTGVPDTPHQPPGMDFQALTQQEAMAVEALTAKMLPGTPEDPGAREAGVVYYIDFLLSQDEGFVEATYRSGPWARGYKGDTEPDPEPDVIWVPADELDRYGYQAPLSPLRIYQIGLKALEDYAQQEFDASVPDLEDDQLDDVIWAMLGNDIEQFEAFSPISFFHTLRLHTAEGFFSDPAYGGNRDLAGWRLVGFPGAQRAYAPEELHVDGTNREPQTMHDLTEFNPGHVEDGPEMPVRAPEHQNPEGSDDNG